MPDPAPASHINQQFSELQKTIGGGEPVMPLFNKVVGGKSGRKGKSKKACRGGKSKKAKKNCRGGKSKNNRK